MPKNCGRLRHRKTLTSIDFFHFKYFYTNFILLHYTAPDI
jgi:hypothetical protein